MAHPSTYEPSTGIERWLDQRLPLPRVVYDQFMVFPTPRNLNYWWTFGGILTFMLVSQIATGVVLAMHYVPAEDRAFDSIEHIMSQSSKASEALKHRLGNLMLLTPGDNSSCGDKMPECKVDCYKGTNLLLAQEVAATIKKEGWTRDSIIAREEKLLKWAKTEWAD